MSPAEIKIVEGLIGKPYRLGAEGPDEFDCYGLARHIQRVVMGYMLPATERDSIPKQLMQHGERQKWRPVETPEPWDIVLMGNVIDRNHHLGTWITPTLKGAVLHANEAMGVCMHDVPCLRAMGFNEIRFFRRKL